MISPYISKPIQRAKATQLGANKRDPQYLAKLAELLSATTNAAGAAGVKSSPVLDSLQKYVAGEYQGLQKAPLGPLEQKMVGVGLDMPTHVEPQDVTEDEADMWVTARAQSYTSAKKYLAQLRKEYDSFANMPTLQRYVAATLNEGETALKNKDLATLQTLNPKWTF